MDIVRKPLQVNLRVPPARARKARVIQILAFAAFAASCSLPSAAAEQPGWKLQTDRAYLAVYAFLCAPSLFAKEVTERTDAMEEAIYESRFRHEYSGDCRAFYFAQIAPRLETAG